MNRITNLIKRVSEFNDDLKTGRLIQRIVLDNEAYIVDMNTQEQLYEEGINRLGVKIMDYAPYSPVTIQIKEMKGQPTNRVTLRDEGDFHDSFYIEVGDKAFEIKASDEKTASLIRKYGRQILGLTNENITELIWEYIYPELMNEAKSRIYGKR